MKTTINNYFISSFYWYVETGTWSIHDVPKDIIYPTFAHSSAYDPATGIIYIHGGFFDNEPSTSLASYDPTTRTW